MMRRTIGLSLAAALLLCLGTSPRAGHAQEVTALLDKAIKALGGEEKLGKVLAGASWAGKGTLSFMEMENAFHTRTTMRGLDHARQEFEGDFGGNKVMGVTVLAGEKGWRSFAGMSMEFDKDALANEKRLTYLTLIPITILPLKEKTFKVEAVAEEKIGEKSAAGIKATGADGKPFNLYFDKESGLPVRLVAKVLGFAGEEFTQETNFSEYQDAAGIKKAMKLLVKRDGDKFIDQQLSDFKLVDSFDAKVFAQPE